jgi:hypothetical protein
MPFTHVVTRSVAGSSINSSSQIVKTAEAQVSIEEVIPDGSTDLDIDVQIDVSRVASFFLVCDKAVTVETNDGTSPDDTIVLKAGLPYYWHDAAYNAFVLSTDVVSLFVTNASGEDALLRLYVLQNISD